MPRSKKKKPGNGRTKRFETIFCIAEMGLLLLIWLLRIYVDATSGELIAIFFIGNIAMIVALYAIDRRAAENAIDILSRPI